MGASVEAHKDQDGDDNNGVVQINEDKLPLFRRSICAFRVNRLAVSFVSNTLLKELSYRTV